MSKPPWTDVAQAWGTIVASMVTFLALVVTIALARADRKRSEADLHAEIKRGEDALRRERSEAAQEQLRTFQLQTLLRVIDLYAELRAAAQETPRARVDTSLRALLLCLPEEIATLVRYDTGIAVTTGSQTLAERWVNDHGGRLHRPVPQELVGLELEANVRSLLPGTKP